MATEVTAISPLDLGTRLAVAASQRRYRAGETRSLTADTPSVALQKRTDDVTHWMVFNIPATAREMPQAVPADAKLPDGSIQIKNAGGRAGFAGPGARAPGPYHHYTFELFALDTKLDLGPDATRAQVFEAMQGHLLDRGILVGRFHR